MRSYVWLSGTADTADGASPARELTPPLPNPLNPNNKNREFLHHHLPALVAEAGAQGVEVRAELKRGLPPTLRAVYRPLTAGWAERARVVGVKNLSREGVAEHVRWLRDSQGRATNKRVPPRHIISMRRSVQGSWSPATWSPAAAAAASGGGVGGR